MKKIIGLTSVSVHEAPPVFVVFLGIIFLIGMVMGPASAVNANEATYLIAASVQEDTTNQMIFNLTPQVVVVRKTSNQWMNDAISVAADTNMVTQATTSQSVSDHLTLPIATVNFVSNQTAESSAFMSTDTEAIVTVLPPAGTYCFIGDTYAAAIIMAANTSVNNIGQAAANISPPSESMMSVILNTAAENTTENAAIFAIG